jgi:hypothetical protein
MQMRLTYGATNGNSVFDCGRDWSRKGLCPTRWAGGGRKMVGTIPVGTLRLGRP